MVSDMHAPAWCPLGLPVGYSFFSSRSLISKISQLRGHIRHDIPLSPGAEAQCWSSQHGRAEVMKVFISQVQYQTC